MCFIARTSSTRRAFLAAFSIATASVAMLATCGIQTAHAQTASNIIYRVDVGKTDTILTSDINEVSTLLTTYGGSTVTKLGRATGDKPLYRLKRYSDGHHYHTIDEQEKNTLIANGQWFLVNIVGYVMDQPDRSPGSVYIYRFYSPNKSLAYFATSSFGLTPSTTTYNVGDLFVGQPTTYSVFDALLPADTYYAEGWKFILKAP